MTDDAAAEPGLSEASTEALTQLAAVIARGELDTPLCLSSLDYKGFGHLSVMMAPFVGLEARPLLSVIRAVLAERQRSARKSLELVWSGSGPSYARYTKIVVPELVAQAQRGITIAGYSFDDGVTLFEQLREAMVERDVAVRFFLDIEQLAARTTQQLRKSKTRRSRLGPLEQARKTSPEAFAKDVLSLFRELHWPYEGKAPDLYYDPRTADVRVFASLHAKCLIVDDEHVLITSANFTGRGQDRNIEVGIVVHDAGYASALERQWNNLVESGGVVGG